MTFLRIIYSFSIVLLLTRCASYSGRIAGPRHDFEVGNFESSIEGLRKLAEKHDNDELLYLMDLGLVYHSAGKYKEAIETFLKADKLAEIKDYTSITEEAASVILNDEVKPYKGEDFEKILINVYLAMDYTLSNQWDDALVECRRVNHKLDRMISEGGLPYQQNAFAKYLAAALFEARGEYNDAFVDYRTLVKWEVDFPYLGEPLLRVADKLRASQELRQYKTQFPSVSKYRLAKNEGQIILLLEQGRVPIKVPSPHFHLVPTFQVRSYSSYYGWLRDGNLEAKSAGLYDIEATAIRELDHKMGAIMAKKIGGVVVKELLAKKVEQETKSPLLGLLTSLALHASDSADLRSWSTLPARLQLARLTVPAGRQDVVLDMVGLTGYEAKAVKKWENIEVKPGQTVFLNYRTPD